MFFGKDLRIRVTLTRFVKNSWDEGEFDVVFSFQGLLCNIIIKIWVPQSAVKACGHFHFRPK